MAEKRDKIYSLYFIEHYTQNSRLEKYHFTNLKKAVDYLNTNFPKREFKRRNYHYIRRIIKAREYYATPVKVITEQHVEVDMGDSKLNLVLTQLIKHSPKSITIVIEPSIVQ